MNSILVPILAVTVIGLICGLLLAVASVVMEVKVDERITAVRECLPGANCGSCGYTGCDGYAKAVVEAGAKTNLCIPGADTAAKAIAAVMGVEAEEVLPMTAVVCCRGDCDHTHKKYVYQGLNSCQGAKQFYGGEGECVYGCLGHGDCMNVCPNGAIRIENGIAQIDPYICTGCGICSKVCPNQVIHVVPSASTIAVLCSNTEPGAGARKACSHACIGWRRCERECPEGAITVRNNLASINYDKCVSCGICAETCPTGAAQVRLDYFLEQTQPKQPDASA